MKLRGKNYFRDKTIRRFQEIKWLWGRTHCTIISSSLQLFWHQGQVSWKTISAWSGDGVGRMVFGWAWDFFGRNDAKAETPVLWPPHAKSWLIGKDSDAGRDWGQEEKGMTEDEMAGWHHWLNGRESGWTPGVGDGQGGLACCDSWGCKESDMTERLNWTEWLATHSSVLAWRIPGTGEPGGLPSMGSHRVGHDWSDLVAAAAAVVKNPSANVGWT